MLEIFLEITTTRLLKMNFPAWQLFLKPCLKNVGLNIWVTILIILMVPIPIWAITLMVQNETVYINIYMKLKNIFSNSNRYFDVLIYYVYILYILCYMYYVTYIMLYIYIYYIYIYMYIDIPLYFNFCKSSTDWAEFSLLGDRG